VAETRSTKTAAAYRRAPDTSKAQVAELTERLEKSRAMWVEEAQKASQTIGLNAQIWHLKRKLELAELIVAGDAVAALKCLFREDTHVFGLRVAFADDATRKAAEKEIADRAVREFIARGNSNAVSDATEARNV
jgi:hypothetical protein